MSLAKSPLIAIALVLFARARGPGGGRQGLIDVLEGNYGGDLTKMPYVVNKEVFIPKKVKP